MCRPLLIAFRRYIPLVTSFRERYAKTFLLVCLFSILLSAYMSTYLLDSVRRIQDIGSENNLILYREVYRHEAWPEVEGVVKDPGSLPPNAHYFWCGEKIFRFEDYLGVLSIVRVLKPVKLIFHYNTLPSVDDNWYHTWFQELKQSVPNLVLQYHVVRHKCGSVEALRFYLGTLAEEGGVYVGERTIVTEMPEVEGYRESEVFHSFRVNELEHDFTQGLVIARRGFPRQQVAGLLSSILNHDKKCYDVTEYNRIFPSSSSSSSSSPSSSSPSGDSGPLNSNKNSSSFSPCLVLSEALVPKDIVTSPTPLAELSRWLFYGERRARQVTPDPLGTPLIPLISHIIWLPPTNIFKSSEFKLLHYLSIMSALHVAGFRRVFVHGAVRPHGHWWDQLRGENVTFLKISHPESIFQQSVVGPAHQSDVLRLNLLNTYGGAYQDRDVIWVSEIPESLRRYPVVACPDWPINGEWPEVFNMGVVLAKPGAEWLSHFLNTFRYYRDDKWAFNAVFMPYKAYEFHPDKIYIDRRLQIICFRGVCHPAWHKDYKRDINDQRPINFQWQEGRSFHFTVPKPAPGLASLEAIRDGQDMFSEIGRMILTKSGRTDLLKS
ncbi:uncharacterized protein LOC101860674 [Aplysia californica]|uniref:Uncharacterized protein LOC101860674 n=1 Tax=Aplysia californica TaxID=6500 RepID=A0ABM0JYA0_APLCA|nr:uncharacterized protein LOC101860674 [Aplysia californica]